LEGGAPAFPVEVGGADDCCATTPSPTSRNPITAINRFMRSIEPPRKLMLTLTPVERRTLLPALSSLTYTPSAHNIFARFHLGSTELETSLTKPIKVSGR
jgi:hypothetical protein